MRKIAKAAAAVLSAAVTALAVTAPLPQQGAVEAVSSGTTLSDMPSEYQYGADWIFQNRIMNEDSMGIKSSRWNIIFDQIIANKGQLNYVVRWQSTQTITYEQRKAFETFVEDGVNQWTDWLVGYENWPYSHVQVNIVGWAVMDRSALLDIHDDEVIWDNISEFDDLSTTQAGVPSVLPCAPPELWTFNYFYDRSHVYNGQSFDQYLWCTQNYGDYGGCGGDWGQRLSDNYYLAAATGSGMPHIYLHELGHGFGMPDFYGGEGESDGFPPGGFPGGENSIMMAGSCSYINDFDGWMLRYMWSQISNDTKRFDLANAVDTSTVTTTTATTTATSETTTSETVTTAPKTDGDGVYNAEYDSTNNYWIVKTGGASKIRLAATGVPWAGVSGAYGYWDNAKQDWIQVDYMYEESLGDTGTAEIVIDFGAENVTDTLQIQVWYYAAWDNAVGDMVAQDLSTLSFAVYTDVAAATTTTTATTTATETTTTTTVTESTTTTTAATTTTDTTQPPVGNIIWGDANENGDCELNDAVLLAKAVAFTGELSTQGKLNCDAYADGKTDGFDLSLVLQLLAGSLTRTDLPILP